MTFDDIENDFLSNVIGMDVKIYLISGVCLLGHIVEIGSNVLIVEQGPSKQMVYKSCVATILLDKSHEVG